MSFLCAALGIFVLADGLFKVQITVDAKPFGIRQWWLILAVALVTAAAGIVLVVRPGESARTLMILMGVSLLAEGLAQSHRSAVHGEDPAPAGTSSTCLTRTSSSILNILERTDQTL